MLTTLGIASLLGVRNTYSGSHLEAFVFGEAVFNQILISEKVLYLIISRTWATSRGLSLGNFEFRGRIIYPLDVHLKREE